MFNMNLFASSHLLTYFSSLFAFLKLELEANQGVKDIFGVVSPWLPYNRHCIQRLPLTARNAKCSESTWNIGKCLPLHKK